MLLLLLAVVTFASMPKWVVHSHDGVHETVAALMGDVSADHYHDDADTDGDGATLPEMPHSHVHYLTGAAATLPSMWLDLFHPIVLRERCPAWCGRSAPDNPQTPLYRPPIV
ncbi:MAG: hypothetical protein BGO50_08745 [Rhodanobacter sp. 67-28]|nr:MAG: hypothetical protein ABS82_08105 [Rhodanobacter sp. SCN 67-45]OJW43258.1 MAG: hypothetical protein BGO50_08745 [Rhodanobacter sp. 67-28]